MKLKELSTIIGGICYAHGEELFQTIQTDSKKIKPGDVFLAIGKGHQFMEEAISKGAVAVICEKFYVGNSIQVTSSVEALGKIAQYYRQQYHIPLIAVTGSVGKTTTKEIISHILQSQYKVLKSEKNHNNHIGLPETLLKITPQTQVVVVELGMNHKGEIAYLSKICKPDYAIITNIGTAHIGNLGSQKNIYKAKMEILEGMDSGYLIVNGEDKYLKKTKFKKGKVIKCQRKKLPIHHVRYYQNRTEFDYIDNQVYHFVLPLPGKAILEDCLLGIQMGLLFDIPIEDIRQAVASFKTDEGRLQITEGTFKIIDDTYNSSYESVIESLKLLKKEKSRKWIVLGDMLEFGKFSKKYHKKINRYLRWIRHKQVLLIGENTKYIRGKHFVNLNSLKIYLLCHIKPGDVVFLKGSRAMNLNKIVEKLKK